MEGIDMGVPCCITAEPGGETPPGGKKTWAIAPEGIQGLALAIQSLVRGLPEALSIHNVNFTPGRSVKSPEKSHSFKLSQWNRGSVDKH